MFVWYQGNTLYFETADQPLPDVTKSKPVMALRIYDVDEAKKSILWVFCDMFNCQHFQQNNKAVKYL